jgi:SpoVK/Ycf46/Vps4 family AAA+-type ATPase
MASASQIRAMLQSHGSGDDERFYSVALQLAASEARRGHTKLAKEIRDLVDQAKNKAKKRANAPNVVSMATPRGEAADLLEEVRLDVRARDLVLPQPLRDRISRILDEQKHLTRLKEHGLRPRQRLLFTGPPGCGKTLTASMLASELALPLFVVRLDSLITRYLGESLSKLRLIFEAVDRSRAIYLFDEFDSIGYARDSGQDVGEMRRLLNSFLVFIEKLSGNSLVIAATNHGEKLDNALYRRFDDLVEFGLPGDDEIWATIQGRLKGVKTLRLDRAKLLEAAKGLSFAEITRACEESVKEMLIKGTKAVSTAALLGALTERRLFLNH